MRRVAPLPSPQTSVYVWRANASATEAPQPERENAAATSTPVALQLSASTLRAYATPLSLSQLHTGATSRGGGALGIVDMADEAIRFFKEARHVLPPEALLQLLDLLRSVSTDADRELSSSQSAVALGTSRMATSTRVLMQQALSILEAHPTLFTKFCELVQG